MKEATESCVPRDTSGGLFRVPNPSTAGSAKFADTLASRLLYWTPRGIPHMDNESLLMEMVRQSARQEQMTKYHRRPVAPERRSRLRAGPRVEPEMRISGDPELVRKDRGILAAFRRM